MKRYGIFTTCLSLSVVVLQTVHAASPASPSDDSVAGILATVPAPELPARAAGLLANAADQEAIALAAVRYTGTQRPGSIVAVVAALTTAAPPTAPALVAVATQLVPSEADSISHAAGTAAPGKTLLGNGNGKGNGNGNGNANGNENGKGKGNGNGNGDGDGNGNRPPIPPGLIGKDNPGAIRGNRPAVPPGHVLDPKPGRGPHRKNNYGSP